MGIRIRLKTISVLSTQPSQPQCWGDAAVITQREMKMGLIDPRDHTLIWSFCKKTKPKPDVIYKAIHRRAVLIDFYSNFHESIFH